VNKRRASLRETIAAARLIMRGTAKSSGLRPLSQQLSQQSCVDCGHYHFWNKPIPQRLSSLDFHRRNCTKPDIYGGRGVCKCSRFVGVYARPLGLLP
jgi:hypothetical protein